MAQGGQIIQPGIQAQGPGVGFQPGGQGNTNVFYYVMQAPQIQQQPTPQYHYVPNDYLKFSIGTAVVVGIFSPLMLVFLIPALYFSWKGKKAIKEGDMEKGRNLGVRAAYLNLTAITVSLLLVTVISGIAIGLYGPEFARQRCIQQQRGELPTQSQFSSSFNSVRCP